MTLRRLPHLLWLLALAAAASAHPSAAMTKSPETALRCPAKIAAVYASVDGQGSVEPSEVCLSRLQLPKLVPLRPSPADGWTFAGWSRDSDCAKFDGDICIVDVTEVQTYTATAIFKSDNRPPTARIEVAAPNPVEVGHNVEFAGSGSDPEGGPVSFSWDFGDGGTADGEKVVHAYTAADGYTATLTVTDSLGARATDSVRVEVDNANQPPSASIDSATPNPALVNQKVSFSGSGKDPEGGALSYSWDFGDGTSGTGATPSHAYSAAGSYGVVLTVTDPQGATGTAKATVNVASPTNMPPTAKILSADPNPAQAGQVVAFAGSGTDPEGGLLSYSWKFGDGTTADGQNVHHAYASGGSYGVTLAVTDDQGATATASVSVTVTSSSNTPPAAAIVSVGPSAPVAGQSVAFAATGSDPEGGAVSFSWSFGDGTIGSGQNVTHAYAAAGTYGVILTVTDPQGSSGTASVSVTVGAGAGPPPSGGKPVIGDAGQPQLPPELPPVRLSLSANTSGNGSIVSSAPGGRALAAVSARIACGVRGYLCYAEFALKTSVTLRAIPAAGSVFARWSGACTGTNPTCRVLLGGDRAVKALFKARGGAASALAAVDAPRFRVRWSSSIGKGRLVVSGRVTKAAVLRVQLRRPGGGPLVTQVVSVLPGRFRIAPTLAPGVLPRGAILLPGGFVVSLRGRTGGTQLPLQLRTIELPAPPEGVVRRAFASSPQGGAPAPTLATGVKEAWAHFVFAAQPGAGRALTVSWYTPDGKLLGTVAKPNRPTVESFVRSDGGLASGFWRAELRAGGRLVKALSVRIQ